MEIGEKEYEKIKANKLRKIVPFEASSVIWKPFYAKYPNANGHYQLSRIGFSKEKQFAFLRVVGAGGYWGSSTDYILKKIKGRWKIYTSFGSGYIE